MHAYDDDYPTCEKTFATLRAYHDEASPTEVTSIMGLEPTKSQTKGEPRQVVGGIAPLSGWFLCSDGEVASKDVRRHIDWALDQIETRDSAIQQLREDGWRFDLNCYWAGVGHGGPILDPSQSERLARLSLRCGFDIYGPDRAIQMLGELQQRGSELQRMMDVVKSELAAHNRFAEQADDGCQYARRTAVRTIFACIEAHISHLKQSALMFSLEHPERFTPEEVLALKDQESFVADNGEIRARRAKIRFKANVVFAFSAFARSLGREYPVTYGGQAGQRFLEAVKIRDRITHPKTADCWEVTKDEMELVREAWCWFGEHLVTVSKKPNGKQDGGAERE